MTDFKFHQHLPKKPGVYFFKDKKKHILYIGKAINLKNRVKSYSRQNLLEPRIQKMINVTASLGYQETKNEIESLLLETRLIKEYRPKYNVRLKDDKRYLYVGLTKEKYPRVRLIRQPEIESGLLDWFGPFPSAQSLREILRLIRQIFPFCTCRSNRQKPCLYYHLKLCPGIGIVSAGEYQKSIQKVRLFLNGEIGSLVKLLTKQMKVAAKNLQFEEAQQFKRRLEMIQGLLGRFKKTAEEEKNATQLEALRKLLVRWQGFDPVIINRLEAYDIANLGREVVAGAMIVFTKGEPEKSLYRQFKIEGVKDDTARLAQVIKRRLNHQEWVYPQLILVDGGKGQITAVFSSLKEKNLAGKIALLGLAKKKETIVIPKISRNHILSWKSFCYPANSPVLQLLQQARDESHRFAQRYYRKLHRKLTFDSFGSK